MLKIKDIYEVAEYTGVGLNLKSEQIVCLKCGVELTKCKCELRLMKCWCCGLNRIDCKAEHVPNPLQDDDMVRWNIRTTLNKARVKINLPPTDYAPIIIELISVEVTLCEI